MGLVLPSALTPAISTHELARRLVTPAQALYCPEFLGMPRPAKPDQAAGLQIARHRFPLPTVLVMGRRMVRVCDIHAFIDGLRPQVEPISQLPPRPKRGRPSNAELAARAAAVQAEVGRD